MNDKPECCLGLHKPSGGGQLVGSLQTGAGAGAGAGWSSRRGIRVAWNGRLDNSRTVKREGENRTRGGVK